VSGNAGSATVLQTARTINGVSFDGSANITVTAAGSTLSDTVTVAKGGTGLTALGTALQVLRVNAGATALEYATAGGAISGTGAVDNAVLRADGTGGATLQNSAFVIADNATASPNNTVNHASIQATGGTTNVSVSIVPKGTGAFCLQVPDGTATGGNARGANAVDLQTKRSSAAQVASGADSFAATANSTASGTGSVAFGGTASGNYSFVASGIGATATGAYSVTLASTNGGASGSLSMAVCGDFLTVSGQYAFGQGLIPGIGGATVAATGSVGLAGGGTVANADHSVSIGQMASTTRWCQLSHAGGRFAAMGDAQSVHFVLLVKTTNATPATMFLNTGGTLRLTIPSGKLMFADILISGIKSDGSAAACYKRKVGIKNVAGTTALVGTVETIGTDIEDNASTDVAITADDTNDALQINVTGIASETWRWVAEVQGVEVAYGT
jgi:hypothetical protein